MAKPAGARTEPYVWGVKSTDSAFRNSRNDRIHVLFTNTEVGTETLQLQELAAASCGNRHRRKEWRRLVHASV